MAMPSSSSQRTFNLKDSALGMQIQLFEEWSKIGYWDDSKIGPLHAFVHEAHQRTGFPEPVLVAYVLSGILTDHPRDIGR